ncbi:MAG: hypothetical protein LQ343_004123 [Gyalolechia ehrenbergii]|nr:MAG: hypothetical protein LQ343_004123 [Gyalolechia ehrenbergii]
MPFRLSLAAAVLASLSLSVLAMPTNLVANTASLQRRGAEGEPFTCPDPSSTSAAKEALLKAGAQSVDIAIAMLENGCAFTADFSAGNNKVNDAAELGVYRNNWHMLRTYCDHFKNTTAADWLKVGSQVHNDVGIATKCQRQLWDTLGETKFFGLQRGGVSNPGAGPEYGEYVKKYDNFCQADGGQHMSDGMAVYWNVASM